MATLLAAVLAVTLAGSLPAQADPGSGTGGAGSTPAVQPTTAGQAKKAWLDASDNAEIASQDLLTAQQHETSAKSAAATAKVTVARADLAVSAAESTAVKAAAAYAAYQTQLSEFASASYRGARLGQLSALLTAKSSADYLDEVSSLDQVAGHTRELMANALNAKQSAKQAADRARTAQQQAAGAKVRADAAVTAAEQATKTVTTRKTALDKQVATYHKLFDSLTAQERQAALDAQQAAWERQAQAQQRADLLAGRQQQAQQPPTPARAGTAASATAGGSSASSSTAGASNTASSTNGSSTSSGASSSSAPSGARGKAQMAVAAALTKLGFPYVYGAAGPSAFDCSGLTSWAWAQAGVTIPRTSSGQSTLPYVPLDQLQPGDLVTYYSPVHHVALYIGNGQIIDASTEGKPIFITSVFRGGPNPTGHRVNY